MYNSASVGFYTFKVAVLAIKVALRYKDKPDLGLEVTSFHQVHKLFEEYVFLLNRELGKQFGSQRLAFDLQ